MFAHIVLSWFLHGNTMVSAFKNRNIRSKFSEINFSLVSFCNRQFSHPLIPFVSMKKYMCLVFMQETTLQQHLFPSLFNIHYKKSSFSGQKKKNHPFHHLDWVLSMIIKMHVKFCHLQMQGLSWICVKIFSAYKMVDSQGMSVIIHPKFSNCP